MRVDVYRDKFIYYWTIYNLLFDTLADDNGRIEEQVEGVCGTNS
jgi:hypothetical protein